MWQNSDASPPCGSRTGRPEHRGVHAGRDGVAGHEFEFAVAVAAAVNVDAFAVGEVEVYLDHAGFELVVPEHEGLNAIRMVGHVDDAAAGWVQGAVMPIAAGIQGPLQHQRGTEHRGRYPFRRLGALASCRRGHEEPPTTPARCRRSRSWRARTPSGATTKLAIIGSFHVSKKRRCDLMASPPGRSARWNSSILNR